MSDVRPICIFDTTLRDGEQSPGASMNFEEKLEVAAALEELGVDVIEAGFPITSQGDFDSVREIGRLVKRSVICGLARCRDGDIDRAWEALKRAHHPRIHVFLATSAIHREFKLRMDQEEIVARAVAGVERAKRYCDDVEFSPEDAARTEIDFLCQVVERAIAAGATTVNIPDTVGYATPTHMGRVIAALKNRVPNIDQAVISTHCHNDLGLAVANSLAAVENGAGQIECTINGIGERAGNCALEEVVMALRTRKDYYQADTRIDAKRLVPTSRIVSTVTSLATPRHKAIVGRNAFAHESGIHQDGMLKEPRTYEIMRPETVGWTQTDLVLGKHSGRAALRDRAESLGYRLSGEQLQEVFEAFKGLADKKKEIFEDDIRALCEQQMRELPESWHLEGYRLECGGVEAPRGELQLRRGETTVTATLPSTSDEGVNGPINGPMDAVFLALEQAIDAPLRCVEFTVHSVSGGKDAQAESTIEVEYQGRRFRGRGVSTDSIEAGAKAYLDAINRAFLLRPAADSGESGP